MPTGLVFFRKTSLAKPPDLVRILRLGYSRFIRFGLIEPPQAPRHN